MPKSLIQGGIVYKWFCNQLLTPIVNNRSYFPKWKGFVNVLFDQLFRVVEDRAFACEVLCIFQLTFVTSA